MKYRYLLLLIACILSTHQSGAMDLTEFKNDNFWGRDGIKQLRHDVRQNPYLYSFVGALCVTASAASCYFMGPIPSLAIQSMVTPTMISLLFSQLQDQARHHKRQREIFIQQMVCTGDFNGVTNLATRNQFDEQDPKDLEEQNTPLLITVLDNYVLYSESSSEYGESQATHCLQAASILIQHHANGPKVIEKLFNRYGYNHKGVMQLSRYLYPKKKLC